ncbi:MAG: methyltransferase domain-containing protein [Myxococcota bacterium]
MRFTLLSALFLLATAAACGAEADEEIARLAGVIELAPGMTVADIGAGDGSFAVELAEAVGAEGRVYATEIEAEKREEIAATAAEAGVTNVEVREAKVDATNLPDGCCGAIWMRHVYHHLTDPGAVNAGVFRALEPGGFFVVVDFPPTWYLSFFEVEGVGESRGGHGITPEAALAELRAAGFSEVRVIEDWNARWIGPSSYALVLRKGEAR